MMEEGTSFILACERLHLTHFKTWHLLHENEERNKRTMYSHVESMDKIHYIYHDTWTRAMRELHRGHTIPGDTGMHCEHMLLACTSAGARG